MTKSELIEIIARKQKHLPAKDVELAVKHLLEIMSDALANGERIEIRGNERIWRIDSRHDIATPLSGLLSKLVRRSPDTKEKMPLTGMLSPGNLDVRTLAC